MMADLACCSACQIVPQGGARQMAHTGERVDAKRALETGPVNAVLADHGAVLEHALVWRARSPPSRRSQWLAARWR